MKNKSYIFACILLLASCTKTKQDNPISRAEMDELLRLSDTTHMTSELEVEYKLSNITRIFQQHNDNRGMFPLVYLQTTRQALLSLQNEPQKYNDILKAKAITIAFCKRYLFNLHDHLIGKLPEYHWSNYYSLCFSGQPRLRIVSAGLNAHLTVDLARAVYDVNGNAAFKDDYLIFGEALVKATPFIVDELKKQYNVESGYLFHGLFIGDILDPLFGANYTTQLAFQFIRQEAFQNGQLLLDPAKYGNAQNLLFNNWKTREQLLDAMVKNKLIQ